MWDQLAWQQDAWLSTGWANCGADEALRTRTARGRKTARPSYYAGLDITLTAPAMPAFEAQGRHTARVVVAPVTRAIAPAPSEKAAIPPTHVVPAAPKPLPIQRLAVTLVLPAIPEFRASVAHRDLEGEAAEKLIQMIEAYD